MKRTVRIIFITITPIMLCAFSACSSQDTPKEAKKDKIVVDGLPEKGIVFIGTKEQIEGTKKDMKELIDPADDYAMEARRLYKQKKYDLAEQEALKAIKNAKHSIVRLSAHNTLLDIYEETHRYDLAIKEIDWLLTHVNEYAKPDLVKKKAEIEKLLQ